MTRTAIITGAAGFIAAHLARRLRDDSAIRIVGLDRVAAPKGAKFDEYMQADLDSPSDIGKCLERTRPDWVFHLAGRSDGDPLAIYRSNVLTTVNLLESLRASAPEARVLLIGSAAEYGEVPESEMPISEEQPCRPVGPYGVSKHSMTLTGLDYARRALLKVVVARVFNVVGPGMPQNLLLGAVLARLLAAVKESPTRPVKVGSLDGSRDFVAVEDVVEACCAMMVGEWSGEVFNICSGRATEVRALVGLALKCSTCPVTLEVDPTLVIRRGGTRVFGDCSKAVRLLGYRPTQRLESVVESTWKELLRRDEERASE
jgi:GDP-4-dehydro-6-deoxy-D-mannose reductase